MTVGGAEMAAGPGDIIYGRPGTYFLQTEVVWHDDKTLMPGNNTCSAAGPGTITLIAAPNSRAFRVAPGEALTLEDVNILGGFPAGDGGNIKVDDGASLTMTRGALSVAEALWGGCLYAGIAASVVLSDVDFLACDADFGGAIFLFDDATLDMSGGIVEYSTADSFGGGIHANFGVSANLSDVTISECSAAGMGGGMNVGQDSVAALTDVTVESCTATDAGGGLSAAGTGAYILSGGTITSNSSSDRGGGISAEYEATVTADGTIVTLNDAVGDGGGLYIANNAIVELLGFAELSYNTAGNRGGGAALVGTAEEEAVLSMTQDATVEANAATGDGGGIFAGGPSTVILADAVVVWNNDAGGAGGGIALDDAALQGLPTLTVGGEPVSALVSNSGDTAAGVRFEQNTAVLAGTAISADSADVYLFNTVVDGHAGMAVSLSALTDFEAYNSYFNNNDAVFEANGGSTLVVASEFTEDLCNIVAAPLSFGENRYCSELSENTGALFTSSGDATALFRTTAMMQNAVPASGVQMRVENTVDLQLTTCMVGNNLPGAAGSPLFIQVLSGGTLTAKQNTFANDNIPIEILSGGTATLSRNAAWDIGAGKAFKVMGGASVSGSENIGDWNAGVSGANNTAPGWVTYVGRGDFHLSAASSAVDICTTDGTHDIEGRTRPLPAGLFWDAGAIEYAP